MIKNREKIDLIYLFLVSLLSFFPNLWVDRANIMEARNFVAAREMVRDGNWIITTMNGNYRFEKPPFPTWVTAFFMKIFNTTSNEYILRLPIAILSVGLIFLIYFFVKIATNSHKLAFTSGLVSSTTFMLIKLGNDNTWDMFAYILIFGCITFIFRGLKENRVGDFVISGVFLGASLLSKGPVPLYGMLLPFTGAYILTYGSATLKKSWKKIVITMVVGGIIAVSWPLAALISQKELFLSIMNKELNTWTTKHTRGFFYYLDYLVYMGVWLVFAVASFYKTWAEKKSEDRKFFSFLLLWNIIILLLLSLIRMKKKRYGVPLFIVTPMMASNLINYYLNKNWPEILKKEKIMLKFHFMLMIIISLGIPVIFYLKGYRNGIISISYLIFIIISFGFFWHSFIKCFFERMSLKKGLFITGLLMIFINIFTTWFIERSIREGIRTDYNYLSSLKSDDIYLPIFTLKSDKIIDVWNVGKKIKKIEDSTKLPENFLFLGEINNTHLKDLLGSSYVIDGVETYYKYEDEDKIIYLYTIKKLKNNETKVE